MKKTHVPALCSVLLILSFAGLWLYSLNPDTVGLSKPILIVICSLILILSLISIIFSRMIITKKTISRLHVAGLMLMLCGVFSFFVLTAPSTINIFGVLAILLGITLAFITALMLAVNSNRNSK